MNIPLVVLVAVLLGATALAFYMDWLGLWISKAELQERIAQSKRQTQGR